MGSSDVTSDMWLIPSALPAVTSCRRAFLRKYYATLPAAGKSTPAGPIYVRICNELIFA